MADVFTVYIENTSRNLTLRPGTLAYTLAAQDQSTMECELISTDESYRPVLNDEIVIVKDERTLTLSLTNGVATFTVTSGTLTADDVGRVFRIPSAGTSGAALVARVTEYTSGTAGTLEFAPGASGSFAAQLGKWKFGGYLTDITESPFTKNEGRIFTVQAADFTGYMSRILINTYWLAGTTHNGMMTTVANTLNFAFGTRQDPAMPAGSAITETFMSPWKNGKEIADRIAQMAGWVWYITPDNVLRAHAPSANTLATMGVTDILESSLLVQRNFNDYRNDQRVFFGGTGEGDFTETIEGDGTTTVWTLLGMPLFVAGGDLLPRPNDYTGTPYVNVFRSGVQTTENITAPGGAGPWTYDSTTNQLTQASGTVLATGDYGELVYRTTFPLVVGAGNAGAGGVADYGFFSRSDEYPDTKVESVAQAYADELIARFGQGPSTKIKITTYDETWAVVGARLPVEFPKQGLTGPANFTVLSVTAQDDESYTLMYEIEASFGDGYTDRWIDFWRAPSPFSALNEPVVIPPDPCADMVFAVLNETWTADGTPFADADGDWTTKGYEGSTSGSDPDTTDYPGLMGVFAMDRVASAGPSTSYTIREFSIDSWVSTGLLWGNWDSLPRTTVNLGQHPTGIVEAQRGKVTIELYHSTAALEDASYLLMWQMRGISGSGNPQLVIEANGSPASATQYTISLYSIPTFDGGLYTDVDYQTTLSRSVIENKWVRWTWCWECGTYTWTAGDPDAEIASDGYLYVTYEVWDGSAWGSPVEVFNQTDLDFYIDTGLFEAGVTDSHDYANRLGDFGIGWYGVPGHIGKVTFDVDDALDPVMGTRPSDIQSASGQTTSANTVSASFAVTPTVGRHIAVFVATTAVNTDQISIADNQGNSVSAHAGQTTAPGVAAWVIPVATSSGTFTVTATLASAATDKMSIAIVEIADADDANPTDLINTGTASGSAASAGSVLGTNVCSHWRDNSFGVGALTCTNPVTTTPFSSTTSTSTYTFDTVIDVSNGNVGGASLHVVKPKAWHQLPGPYTEAEAGAWRSPRWNVSAATAWKAVGIAFRPAET